MTPAASYFPSTTEEVADATHSQVVHPTVGESTAADAETAATPSDGESIARRSPAGRLPPYQALTHMGFVMRSTACNAKHSVEQRLARWLLTAHDRVGGREFTLTQEFAAMMLGASRPTVSIVAGTLQRAGLITYRRGFVHIEDRSKLEAVSRECYRVTTELLNEVTVRRGRAPSRLEKRAGYFQGRLLTSTDKATSKGRPPDTGDR